jgi:peptide/nickel transport system ATP-binding protein
MAPLIELRDLTVELPTPGGWVRPVNQISLQLESGSSLGLAGESGSGKTMLALALMGLLPPGARLSGSATLQSNGSGEIDLTQVAENDWPAIRGRRIAMVFQEPMTALNPVMRVGAQIAEAIRAHNRGLAAADVTRRVHRALERAAVPEPEVRARQYPHELSGGLRQRALIAMAIAAGEVPGNVAGDGAESRLLIADEPTTALDVQVQRQILELLARLRRELGLSLIFITHDLAVAAQVADRLAVVYAGRIVEEGPTLDVLRAPRHPYTQGLLSASPRISLEGATERKPLVPIPGMAPALDALPPGCAFEPRCPLRKDECTRAMPDLRVAGPNHTARCILV